MKKILSLLVAMLMLLNLSFAVAEGTFEENLEAVLSEMNVQNGDLLLDVDANGQALAVQLGLDELGLHAAASMAGQTMGELLIAQDAAYVSAMGMGYKVKFQTVTDFVQKMITSMFGELNISPEQISADLQMLVGKLYMPVFSLLQAVNAEEVENGTKYVVNGETLAEALTTAIDNFLGDADVAACIDRYAGLLRMMNIEVSAEALKNNWEAKKEQVKAGLSGMECTLTTNNDGTYALEMIIPNGENKVAVLSNGSLGENVETLTTAGIVGEDPEVTAAFSVKDGVIVYDVKMEEATIYEEIALDGDELKSFDYVVTMNGETFVEAHYSENLFTMTTQDFTMKAEVVTKEAKKMEVVMTVNQNGEEQVMNVTLEVLDAAIAYTISAPGADIKMTLSMTEKGTWTDLTQAENMTELTEEMLMSLLGSI